MKWRTVALVALVAVFGLMFSSHFNDLADVVQVSQHGQPGWLAVALGLQLLWFWNQAVLYRSIYHLLGLPARTAQLLPIVLASNFLNFITPSASLGAVALCLDDARQRGLDPGRVALASVVRLVLNLVWFVMLLSFSLTVLAVRMELLTEYVVAASLLLTAAALVIGGLVLAALWPDHLAQLLGRVGGLLDGLGGALLHRDLLAEERARRFGLQFGQAGSALWAGRGRLPRPWLHVMLFDGLQLGVLYAMVRAFPGDDAAINPVFVSESLIGLSLMLGLLTRAGALLGTLQSINLLIAQGATEEGPWLYLGLVAANLAALFTPSNRRLSLDCLLAPKLRASTDGASLPGRVVRWAIGQ